MMEKQIAQFALSIFSQFHILGSDYDEIIDQN